MTLAPKVPVREGAREGRPAKPAKARTRLNPRNRKRAAKALAEDFGDLANAVRRLPCCVQGCRRWPCDPAHVVTRARGRAWIEVDGVMVGNIAPLCRGHHTGAPGGPTRPQHNVGIQTFEAENVLELRLPSASPAVHATLAEVAAAVGRWFLDGARGDDGPC